MDAMRIVDARSGEDVVIGKTICYPDLESVTVLGARPGLISVELDVRTVHRNFTTGRLDAREFTTRVPIRFMHPGFMFQRVAFLPT